MFHMENMARKKRNSRPHVFGKVVVAARKKKGWSRYKLIAASGHSASQVYAIEKGDNEPTLNTLLWVARALDMDPRELFNDLYIALEEERLNFEKNMGNEDASCDDAQ